MKTNLTDQSQNDDSSHEIFHKMTNNWLLPLGFEEVYKTNAFGRLEIHYSKNGIRIVCRHTRKASYSEPYYKKGHCYVICHVMFSNSLIYTTKSLKCPLFSNEVLVLHEEFCKHMIEIDSLKKKKPSRFSFNVDKEKTGIYFLIGGLFFLWFGGLYFGLNQSPQSIYQVLSDFIGALFILIGFVLILFRK